MLTVDSSDGERLVVGLMSGSSGDGIDAALVRIEGCCERAKAELVEFSAVAYGAEQKEEIFRAWDPVQGTVDHLCLMNAVLGELFAAAALDVIARSGLGRDDVALVSVWPQMVYHYPGRSNPQEKLGYTLGACLQLGDLNVVAERTGVTTVGAFCARDIARGGNGAPLTGLGDYVLYHAEDRNRAIQNIGGIANVNLVPAEGGLEGVFGFDTGPGNMVIDAVVRRLTDGALDFDEDGLLAAAGTPAMGIVEGLLQDPFLQAAPPKATGRENFGVQFSDRLFDAAREQGLSDADVAATATALTVESIASAYERFVIPRAPIDEVIVGGGGASNPTLLRMLRARLGGTPVRIDDDYGIPSSAKEAIYMALLGNETVRGHANNVPSVTGADGPVVMGLIAPVHRS